MVNFCVFLPVWGLKNFSDARTDAKFYRRCCCHVLMPVQRQNTEINSSDALSRQYCKSSGVSVCTGLLKQAGARIS